ncbi:hypothetical protein JOQ06_016704 [Pogonophryne albipinna]|uniref:Uncharacterized protein n=1 Tax=Pogonophryne albipinna TaxID=1090488 RepID=A0AAD6B235_9TELE|nr:hypothetical protein JOQ06_016704 [Pogonophryne albipinna]
MSCAVVIKPKPQTCWKEKTKKTSRSTSGQWQLIDSCEPEMSLSIFLGYLQVEQGCRWKNIKEKMQLCTDALSEDGIVDPYVTKSRDLHSFTRKKKCRAKS